MNDMVAYRTGHNSGLARKSAGFQSLQYTFYHFIVAHHSPSHSQSLRFRNFASPIILATPSPPLQTPWDRESSPVVPEFQLFQNFNCSIFVFHSLKFQNCYKMVDHESGQPIGAVENLDSASIEPNPSQPVLQTENATTQIGKKRNEMKERSDIWVHFEKINDENNNLIKAKCIYCKRVWAADPKKHGTTNLRSHMVTCKQIPTLISPS
nr:zinc finger BED domain-containing protein RICESLEEPER 2-like [Ipomoea batatas]